MLTTGWIKIVLKTFSLSSEERVELQIIKTLSSLGAHLDMSLQTSSW